MEHGSDGDTNGNWYPWNDPKVFEKKNKNNNKQTKNKNKKKLVELEIGGRIEPIQNAAPLRSVRILGRVQESWGDLLSLKKKTPVKTSAKKMQQISTEGV